jgi:hypothetical protein
MGSYEKGPIFQHFLDLDSVCVREIVRDGWLAHISRVTRYVSGSVFGLMYFALRYQKENRKYLALSPNRERPADGGFMTARARCR